MLVRLTSSLIIASITLLPPALSTGLADQTADPSRQGVVWTNTINCTVNGDSVTKTAGRDDTSDAAARSQQTIAAGGAYLEFTVAELNKTVFCGLTHAAIGTDFHEIDFSIKLTSYAYAEVRENNDYKAETPYRVGDVFRISADGNIVAYFKNDALIYTSTRAPSFPLFVQAAFIGLGSRIDNASIGATAITSAAEWRMYQQNTAHTAYSTASQINASNASTLAQAWSFQTGDWITGTPVVAGGVVYIGSWDGKMYALRESDGARVWTFDAGTITVDACNDTYGIDSTAALIDGKLYFGTGDAKLYALDAATGNLIWRTQLADPLKAYHIYGSPTVSDGKIYLGLASHCVNPCVTGRLLCVSAADGHVIWSFDTAPEGSTGGAVWSSVAVDPSRRVVYVGTGNFCTGSDTHSTAVLALNADTGALVWEFKKLFSDLRNFDFGASPVLFDVSGTQALAIGCKDGHVYSLNRTNGELLWDTQITDGSSIGGTIASPAAAYGMVFLGCVVNTKTGRVVALDQRTGRIVWQAEQPVSVIGAAAVAGGAVFIGVADGTVRAYDALTGAQLWSVQRGPFYGGVSVSGTKVLAGSIDKSVYAFSLASSQPQPKPTVVELSPASGDVWVVKTKYDIMWNASAGVNKVDVSISRDGGTTWDTLASGLDAAVRTFRVKAKKPRSENVLVRVSDSSDPSVFGNSGVFRIR